MEKTAARTLKIREIDVPGFRFRLKTVLVTVDKRTTCLAVSTDC